MKSTLLIPTLNEIDGMKQIMPRIRREWVDEIIVVDGKSTDGTAEFAKEQGCFVLEQKTKGLVNAYREALEIATGDIIVTFTPDGNSIPELIPALISKMAEGFDMVIVSRYREGAKSYDDDVITRFGNWMFTNMINILFGGHYTDSLVGFRAWKKDLFKFAQTNRFVEIGGFEPLSSVKCAKLKLRVCEIPGDEPPRIGGIRKMRPLINGTAILLLIIKELLPHK
ncbi:MAG: glycosyltransferase family 2 protein [Candidatus Omnitrophota bacterium]